jgi:hypothetical protein
MVMEENELPGSEKDLASLEYDPLFLCLVVDI